MAQGSGIWTYSYDVSNTWGAVTAPSGAITTYNYFGTLSSFAGNISSIQRPEGYTSTYVYDATSGFKIGEQIPAGWVTSILSNSNALPLVTSDALGHRTSYLYDSVSNLTTYTDAVGAVSTYGYDSNRNMIRMADPLGRVTSYAYNASGEMTAMTDPRGLITTNAYDSFGNLASVMASDGGITTYGYDVLNRLTTLTDPINRTTTLAYDNADNVISSTDPTGAVTQNIYNSGYLQATIGPLGYRTSFVYDRFGNMISKQDALGHFTTYSYNSLGLQVSMMDANGNISSSVYNNAQQKVADVDALGSVCQTYDSTGNLQDTFRYSPYGRSIVSTGSASAPAYLWVGSLGYRDTAREFFEYYVRARHYSTSLGRWTTVDLLWPRQGAYNYTKANPTVMADPSGKIAKYYRNDCFQFLVCGDMYCDYVFDFHGLPKTSDHFKESFGLQSRCLLAFISPVKYSCTGSLNGTIDKPAGDEFGLFSQYPASPNVTGDGRCTGFMLNLLNAIKSDLTEYAEFWANDNVTNSESSTHCIIKVHGHLNAYPPGLAYDVVPAACK